MCFGCWGSEPGHTGRRAHRPCCACSSWWHATHSLARRLPGAYNIGTTAQTSSHATTPSDAVRVPSDSLHSSPHVHSFEVRPFDEGGNGAAACLATRKPLRHACVRGQATSRAHALQSSRPPPMLPGRCRWCSSTVTSAACATLWTRARSTQVIAGPPCSTSPQPLAWEQRSGGAACRCGAATGGGGACKVSAGRLNVPRWGGPPPPPPRSQQRAQLRRHSRHGR